MFILSVDSLAVLLKIMNLLRLRLKGSYTLLIKLSESLDVEVGSLGSTQFSRGFYAYNGSAFGPGGLKRVDRHREKSTNGDDPHWHIDYLLIQESSEVIDVFKAESDHECSLSQKMMKQFDKVDNFGCSDCDCKSHVFYSKSEDDLRDFLEEFYPNQEEL